MVGARAAMFARATTRVLYAFSPVATYTPQFYEVKSSGKEGFSSATCLVVLALSILRVAFWIVRRVREWSFLVYSITLPLMQFYLLEAIISARHKKGEQSPQRRRRASAASAAALGSNVKKLARAWWNGGDDQALWRKLRKSFWAWDELPPYVEVVVVMSIAVALVSAAALRVFSRDDYSWFLGTCVAVCDVLVAAPQLRMNCVRRDTSGLSTLMVVAWLARDALLLFDQRLTSAQNEQLGAIDSNSSNWQHQVVSSPRTGLAVFRVGADALLLAQIVVFSYFAPFFHPQQQPGGERRQHRSCLFFSRPRRKTMAMTTIQSSSSSSSSGKNNNRHLYAAANNNNNNRSYRRNSLDVEEGKQEDEDPHAVVPLLDNIDSNNQNGRSSDYNEVANSVVGQHVSVASVASQAPPTPGVSSNNRDASRGGPSAGMTSTAGCSSPSSSAHIDSSSPPSQKMLLPIGLKKKHSDVDLSSLRATHAEDFPAEESSSGIRSAGGGGAAAAEVPSGSLTGVTGVPRGRSQQQHVSL